MFTQQLRRERPLNDEEAAELMARLTERAAHDPANGDGGGDGEQTDGGEM